MRVLYVNHTGELGGGEQSLVDLLAALPHDIEPVVACPEGPLADAVRALGVAVFTVAPSELSFRMDLPSLTRGLSSGLRAAYVLRRIARRVRPALVHANSVRAGLLAPARAPLVVHVRDCLPRSLSANLVRRVIRARAALIVANSRYTAASFGKDDTGPPIRTIYNPVDLERFDPAPLSRSGAREQLGLHAGVHAVGVVAQITPWKAQDDAIRTLARVRPAVPDTRLLIVGAVKFAGGAASAENESYAVSLGRLADELGVADDVVFLGERRDVPHILRALDLLLVPSWEEPFGRSVVEAMAMGVPVLATELGGPAEIITDGEDGLLLPPRSPGVWAEAVALLLADEERRAEMGRRARETVTRRFSSPVQVASVVSAYDEVLGRSRLGSSKPDGRGVAR